MEKRKLVDRKILQSYLDADKPSEVLMENREELFRIIPELKATYKFNQHSVYHKHDVFEHLLSVVDGALDSRPSSYVILIAALFHDIGKPECFTMDGEKGHTFGHPAISAKITNDRLYKLGFADLDVEMITWLVKKHDMEFKLTKQNVKKMLNKINKEFENFKTKQDIPSFLLYTLFCLKVADADDHLQTENKPLKFFTVEQAELGLKLIREVQLEKINPKFKGLEFDGYDAMSFGFYGKQAGNVLKMVQKAVESGKINNSSDEIYAFVQKYYDIFMR